ncbi:DsbA family protein [Sporosarcina sp. HYO08]|uniref:DsbA family oxidoreductase n=1 Tax=Sporosarcina sp. HYO08 TaxID=1759557 RepID=UPI0007923836|nr:DsbA family oxidoreductase [Sporosarcina sp. HYO08]KXH80915.1 disulfide bond formation protein DsbA [Sporosarcina sp. HYO08]
MKIEVWSDYVCPFCYIGKRRLEQALKEMDLDGKAEIVFKAFELEPDAPATSDERMEERLAKKYGMTVEEAEKMTGNVALQAESVDLKYDFENMRPANTFNAHRLAKLAEQEGVGEAVAERLLKAYFVEAEKIGTDEVLLDIAEGQGIARERAASMLQSNEFAGEVKKDIAEAGQIGVRGVPFFVINRKYALSGAHPVEKFVDTLQKAQEES